MNDELLNLLINPYTGNQLKKESDSLVDVVSGERFAINGNIPVLLRKEEVTKLNRLYQKRYDWLVYIYDFMMLTLSPLIGGKEAFRSIAEIIEVNSGERVLETSVGTGIEIKNLVDHGMQADYYGMDISSGMLKKCQRNKHKWNIDIKLVQGNAETVPFKDELFDVVFHIGGINFFNDKEKAIQEMIRVAKPGARLYICDETAKQVEEQPRFISFFYQKPDPEVYEPPLKFIPGNMLNVVNHMLWDEKMYLVSFQKPE